MTLSLQFLGGVGTVTGSKYLLRYDNQSVLIDCGLFQGVKDLRLQNWATLPLDPKQLDAVILTHAHLDHTGYQAAGTRGRLLQGGISELKFHGQYVPVKAHIEEISTLSAHADQREILDWLRNFKSPPKKIFIVHGEAQASDALRVRIQDTLGWDCHIPKFLEAIELQ